MKSSLTTRSILIALAVLWAVPLLWPVVCSFHSTLIGGFPEQLGKDLTLVHYRNLPVGLLTRSVMNSGLAAMLCSLVGTSLSVAVCFGLLCRRYPSVGLFLSVASGRTIPAVLILLPQVLLVRRLGFPESLTLLGLLQSFAGFSTGVFFLAPFAVRLFRDHRDLAQVDGASSWQFFFWVFLPEIRAPLRMVACIAFLSSWTDFLYAGLFAVSDDKLTVPVFISRYLTSYGTAWGSVYASLVFTTACCVLILFGSMRAFERGATLASVAQGRKG